VGSTRCQACCKAGIDPIAKLVVPRRVAEPVDNVIPLPVAACVEDGGDEAAPAASAPATATSS
jgi:hypothetical protein